MNYLGRHILIELFECSHEKLKNRDFIEKVLKEAAAHANATVVSENFYNFDVHGISGVLLIKESHITIHTWPEYGYAAIDLFTCGKETKPWLAFDFLKEEFEAKRDIVLELKRGLEVKP
ncbi:MAG: adenosylmethionine decarboxylase [Spirochaetales bacterium]|nr:adenosylmethionine decarboxylase [Spirochaetales bacterium]